MSFRITGDFKIIAENGDILFNSGSSVSTNSSVSQNNLESSDNVADNNFIIKHPSYIYYRSPNIKLGTYKSTRTSPRGDEYAIDFTDSFTDSTVPGDIIDDNQVYYKISDNNKGGGRKTKKRRSKR